MALTIGSSISPLTSPGQVSSTGGVAGTPGAGSDTNSVSAALYLNLGISELSTGPLGIRSPQNPEDAAMILAQAELALDKTAGEGRKNEIETSFGGARGAIADAIAQFVDASNQLTAAVNEKATDQTQLTDAQRQQTSLQTQSDDLGKQATTLSGKIADLNGQIAAAQAANKPDLVASLKGQRDGVQTQLNQTNASKQNVDQQLKTVTDTVNRLTARIAELDTKIIPALTQTAQQRSLALTATFSQLALTVQTGDGAYQRNAGKSVRLDLGFDDLNATSRDVQDGEVQRSEQDAQTRNQLDGDVDKRRIAQLAAGLIAGLTDALSVLRQSSAAPSVNSSEAAIAAGDRFRLAI